jgi:bifunctional N-acetylglucosamine-1-phosphate-uridyltransferase/glucosamine-1-phosphate-acetyltransferase GlmU-like protein
MIRTFILSILTYGLEIVLPKGKNLNNINRQYKKWIKQILSLNINVADPAVFILAGTLPIETEIHIKAITLYGNITRAKKSSIEWKLALVDICL